MVRVMSVLILAAKAHRFRFRVRQGSVRNELPHTRINYDK